MTFFLCVFAVIICSKSAVGVSCPENLHKFINESFNLSEKGEDNCTIENPTNSNVEWTVVCMNKTYTLIPKKECSDSKNNLNPTSVALVQKADTTWKILSEGNDTSRMLDDCLKTHNVSSWFYVSAPSYSKSVKPNFKKSHIKRKRNTKYFPTLPSVSTYFWTDFTTPFSTITDSINNYSTIVSTTPSNQIKNSMCEENEHSFQDHCYFLKYYDKINGLEAIDFHSLPRNDASFNFLINSTKLCMEQHPNALGLAVETTEENTFVIDVLKKHYFFNRSIILTSGVKKNGFAGIWRGWNTLVNHEVINCPITIIDIYNIFYYVIDPTKQQWKLRNLSESLFSNKITLHLMCERPNNPKRIIPSLYSQCLQYYRNSKCYDKSRHENFCCAKDENEELWFSCPREKTEKKYKNGLECFWYCGRNGLFSHEYPICTGKNVCHATYKGIKYSAPINKYAISDCPGNMFGYSRWYCNQDGTFVREPDYSLCCKNVEGEGGLCRDVDTFLNFWMACPGKTALKNSTCPPNYPLKEAVLEWACLENGTFKGTSPDYSNCEKLKVFCKKEDQYGVLWVASPGVTQKKHCPPDFTGFCFWKCSKWGEFETPEPDYSKCRAKWMNEVSTMIKNGTNHEEVMEVMNKHTKVENIKIGFHHVLNLTTECVDLFKKQNSEKSIPVFKKFLKSYSKVLGNIANDPNTWSSFTIPNRKEYADQILETTQAAAFANLKLQNSSSAQEEYNVTVATFERDGYDFFVSYKPSIVGLKFPLENFSESDWQLEVQNVDESGSNFVAMGLVLNDSVSSLMFPQEDQLEKRAINSPIVTFTVVSSKKEQLFTVPDVTVHLSFKHLSKTRFPMSEVIRRKLHEGETPSGIFNSTLCYFYRHSNWSTDGCVVTFTSKDETVCTCYHLSTIGLLMNIHKYVPDQTLEKVSLISSGVTIISLILAIIVFYVFDSVRNERVLIGKNLCFCLLLGHTLLISVMDKRFFYIPDNLCTVYAVLLHYVFMAAFAWMFVEGCHLYRMLVFVFDSNVEYRYIYLLFGYGAPLIIVVTTALIGFAFQEQPYGQDELCWLKPPNYVWAFMGPVIVTTLPYYKKCPWLQMQKKNEYKKINFFILVTAMKLAISSKMKIEKSNFKSFKVWLKGWISLSTLLGITWLLGLALIHYEEAFVYSFVVLNGLQGFFIFLFRCIFNEQYKGAFLQKFKSWFSHSRFCDHKVCENNKSGTNLFAISQSGFKTSLGTDTKNFGYDSAFLNRLDSQIHIHKNILKNLDNSVEAMKENTKKESDGFGVDIEITITPAVSEKYLRDTFTTKNLQDTRAKKKETSLKKDYI